MDAPAKLLALPPIEFSRQCSSCHWFRSQHKEGGFCRRMPPTVFLIPQQGRLGQIEPQAMSHFPPVKAEWECGEWLAKPMTQAGPVGKVS